ncbi:hypothetical protein AMECASPLE_030098 [Ameca splendens]|uniref:Uncharacterized protein n=1 Tax=Ameca splendens TaxID=208324 RepID=A0ABV0YT53_9TELE
MIPMYSGLEFEHCCESHHTPFHVIITLDYDKGGHGGNTGKRTLRKYRKEGHQSGCTSNHFERWTQRPMDT